MDKYQLYELLDMEEASDFRYFENFADLMESDDHIESDTIYALLSEINLEDFGEISGEYFEQTMETMPDSETEFYTLVDNMKRVLQGMCMSAISAEDENDKRSILLKLADEIEKMRSWYVFSMNVESVDEDTQEIEMLSVRDALFQLRGDKFGESSHRYDFSPALDYELEEYIMNFADLATEE